MPYHFLSSVLAIVLPLCANAFYLPGTAPHNYHKGEKVNLFVNALTPMLSGHNDAKLVRRPDMKARMLIPRMCTSYRSPSLIVSLIEKSLANTAYEVRSR